MISTRRHRGFSLLELLIVVAIILIIATIAIPSFLRTRQVANESSAVANLRTLNNAEGTYLSSSAGNYGTVSQLVLGGLLDSRFNGAVSGYTFNVATSGFDYTATATPLKLNNGRYGYYLTADGVVRYSTDVIIAPPGQAGNPVSP